MKKRKGVTPTFQALLPSPLPRFQSETTLARQSKLPARTCLPLLSSSPLTSMLLPHRTAWTTPLEFQSVFSDLFESDASESRQLIALSRVSQHSLSLHSLH